MMYYRKEELRDKKVVVEQEPVAEQAVVDRYAMFSDRRRARNRRVNDLECGLKRSHDCRRKSGNRRRSFDLSKSWYLKVSYVDNDLKI